MTAFLPDEVIGCPGQNLTALERAVLVAMANGQTQPEIVQATGTDPVTLRILELQVRAKLGARTQSHMIARGFTLGVLLPRALCLLLCTMSALEVDQDFLRPRSQRRTRSAPEHSRLVKSSPAAAGGSRPLLVG